MKQLLEGIWEYGEKYQDIVDQHKLIEKELAERKFKVVKKLNGIEVEELGRWRSLEDCEEYSIKEGLIYGVEVDFRGDRWLIEGHPI
ncbi:MAG: hypothetical protein HUJ26_19140 [Planctomycetaceae bacterium]|nr:hypothetical protein [Planctomycetaceae bacterium]